MWLRGSIIPDELAGLVHGDAMQFSVSSSYTLHPDGRLRVAYDWLLVVALLYSIFTVPFRFAFNVRLTFAAIIAPVEFLVDFIFLVEIFLNFRTGYYNNGARPTRSHSLRRFFCKGCSGCYVARRSLCCNHGGSCDATLPRGSYSTLHVSSHSTSSSRGAALAMALLSGTFVFLSSVGAATHSCHCQRCELW